jgi:uncharacterized protein (DUF3084 family)
LPKLPDLIDGDDELKFWLALFKAKTEEDLNRIMEMGVSIMNEAIDAYKSVSVSQELYEIERLRDLTRRNEASALAYEREKATAEAEAKAAAEAAKAEERFKREIANKDTEIANRDSAIANKDTDIANKEAEIMRLRTMLNQLM